MKTIRLVIAFFFAASLWAANPTVKYFSVAGSAWANATVYGENDIVVGSDGENYYCISAHTSETGVKGRPTDGTDYATYWALCDGTTWAKRAVLFNAVPATDIWSTQITGFNFTTDGVVAYIGPGTHTVTVALASGLFANPPTAANPLIFHGCDSSGAALVSPDKDWVSASPAWDDSGLPVVATTGNIASTSLATAGWRLVKFTASGRNGAVIGDARNMDWCSVTNSTANTAAAGIATTGTLQNGLVTMSGSSYDAGVKPSFTAPINNMRIMGVTGSSGDRRGIEHSGTSVGPAVTRCTIIGHGGDAIGSASTSAAQWMTISNCVLANNGGGGITLTATAAQTAVHLISNCMITGNGGYALDAMSAAQVLALANRTRDNASGGLTGMGNWPTNLDTYTTDSDDASEYVNAAGGDYRIKSTATIAGMGFGVAEQAAAAGAEITTAYTR